MKRWVLGCFVLLLSSIELFAAPPVYEMPIVGVGVTQTVAITTYTWTKISSTTNGILGARTGVFVVNYSTNAASIGLVFSASAPANEISERDVELQPGEWDVFPAGVSIDLYAIYYGSSGTSLQSKEVKQ